MLSCQFAERCPGALIWALSVVHAPRFVLAVSQVSCDGDHEKRLWAASAAPESGNNGNVKSPHWTSAGFGQWWPASLLVGA